jgi:hypothetical protein
MILCPHQLPKASAMHGNTVAFGLPLNDFAHEARILTVCSAAQKDLPTVNAHSEDLVGGHAWIR